MTTSIWAFLAIILASLAILVVMTLTILFFMFRLAVPGFMAQARTARYAFAYDDALQWLGVSGRKRKELLAELGSNIADAAADASVSEVLARLGEPKDLARAVAATKRGPSWGLGAGVALTLWFLFQLGSYVGLDVLATGVEDLGVADASVHATTYLLPGVEFDMTTGGKGDLDTISVAMGPLFWVAPMLAFALFSKPWRLIRKRRASTVDA